MERICLWEGRSAPLSPATPCPTQPYCKEMLPPQERLSGRRETDWGWFFGCLVLLRVEESQIPCTLPKMYQGAGTSLVHP